MNWAPVVGLARVVEAGATLAPQRRKLSGVAYWVVVSVVAPFTTLAAPTMRVLLTDQ